MYRNPLNYLLRTKLMSTRIDVVEHPKYRTINVSGAVGIEVKDDIQITLFSVEINCDDVLSEVNFAGDQIKARRIIECRLLLDPVAAKSLQDVVNSTIANYEKTHGEIKMPTKTIDASKDSTDTNVSTPYT
jgi:hypothetical protein